MRYRNHSRASVLARCLLVSGLLAALATPARAQGSGAGDGARIGIYFGGISTLGVTVELFDDTHAVELSVGTWSFRDLSVSAVYKEYFGAGDVRPFVGGGLWTVIASPPDGQTGAALVLRAPIGFDWGFADRHALGAALNVNLGLAVRRTDPEDDLPMNRRLVPLPEVYYRFRP
jgi:hypothetical protein